MNPTHSFSVPDDCEGERLDRCLALLQPGWTRSQARRLVDQGSVQLNQATPKPSTPVHTGDLIEVEEPPPRPSGVQAEDLPLDVLWEDDDLLVLTKPPGLVIHPAAGNPSGTLVNALLAHCENLSGIGGVQRPGIVHRLDKDTSGLMVVAKSDHAHVALSLAFRRRQVSKTYLAICYGVPTEGETVIEAPIGRHPRERRHMAVVADGRPSRTIVTVEERLAGTAFTSCRLVTGRTHQIRVHLAHIGHAVVGDPAYSGRQWRNLTNPRHQAACSSFPRQALHAGKLAFTHPRTGEEVRFESPLPEDMAGLLAVLRS